MTPVKRYVDSLSFKFIGESDGNCKIEAYSRSDLWYAVLDYGTNYCNLRNLLDGTGLSGSDGFQESTRNKIYSIYEQGLLKVLKNAKTYIYSFDDSTANQIFIAF